MRGGDDKVCNMEQTAEISRLLLKQEIEEFLYHEADLLDERRYEDWLALLADDMRYWMPMRRNVKVGEQEREFTREDQDINWFDEGKDTLSGGYADPDRHPLGRGAGLAHLPHRLQRPAPRDQPLGAEAGRGRWSNAGF